MCGIAGYFGPSGPDEAHLKSALELMRRRGPDSQNARHYAKNGREAILLHSRLSIIDLVAAANQPYCTDEGSLVFNGELYNYIELRKQLEAEGVVFRTRSDTEVLIQVLQHWGWRGLDRCEGMWAFAFYDIARGTLLLARDRFGEKPLFLQFGNGGEVWFGSEPKFIAALRGRSLAPNEEQVLRFLVNGYKSLYKGTDTFFRDVISLEPGRVLEIDRNGAAREFRYWTPAVGIEQEMSFDDAVAGTRERLIRSLELRLRADVPLAFCMSGGVDSNACIGIASRVLRHDVKAFTIVNTDERYEEMDIVEQSVRELGVDHTQVHLSKDRFLDGMQELVRYHDAPVYTITYYVHWLLQQAISQAGFRISISGTGADEMFTGYYDHHAFYLAAVAPDRALYDRSLKAWKDHIAPIVRNPVLQDPDVFRKNPAERSHIYFGADSFAQYVKQPFKEEFEEKNFASVPLRNRMLNEMFHETVPVILHEDDLNAMYYSVENRSPFLDRSLFEFSSRIPTRHLIRDGAAKAVLREAIRGIAPDIVVDSRRKVGFNAPIQDLLDMNDDDARRRVLADGPIFDLVDRDRISALMTDERLSNSRSKLLFNFVSSRFFLDTFAQ